MKDLYMFMFIQNLVIDIGLFVPTEYLPAE